MLIPRAYSADTSQKHSGAAEPTVEMYRLHLLCLFKLGQHGTEFQKRKNMGCDTKHKLIKLIVTMANQDLTGGASEPAAGSASEPTDHKELVAGQHPNVHCIQASQFHLYERKSCSTAA